ncbi:MAG: hypothetical protein Q4A88_05620, partial [Clostridia bacterium]|nr:hypothetical protein [Clostridia bacterium]
MRRICSLLLTLLLLAACAPKAADLPTEPIAAPAGAETPATETATAQPTETAAPETTEQPTEQPTDAPTAAPAFVAEGFPAFDFKTKTVTLNSG